MKTLQEQKEVIEKIRYDNQPYDDINFIKTEEDLILDAEDGRASAQDKYS